MRRSFGIAIKRGGDNARPPARRVAHLSRAPSLSAGGGSKSGAYGARIGFREHKRGTLQIDAAVEQHINWYREGVYPSGIATFVGNRSPERAAGRHLPAAWASTALVETVSEVEDGEEDDETRQDWRMHEVGGEQLLRSTK